MKLTAEQLEPFRRWGLKGGYKRAAVLTPERRIAIATKASKAAAKVRSAKAEAKRVAVKK